MGCEAGSLAIGRGGGLGYQADYNITGSGHGDGEGAGVGGAPVIDNGPVGNYIKGCS